MVGLSNRKFILRSESDSGWDEVQENDLSSWFPRIRKFTQQDLVMEKIVWVQSRGIPMNAWLEENVKAYTKNIGEWISLSYQKDELNDLFDPVFCFSTRSMDKEEMIILVRGIQYSIKFEEILDPRDLVRKTSPM